MIECEWGPPIDGVIACSVCGKRMRYCGPDVKHTANCGDVAAHAPRPGLGDRTEAALKRVGITTDRYKALKKRLGLQPRCGCAARKAWLNRVAAWLQGTLRLGQ